ncbi:MAG: hypothetical protein ACRCYU_18840 [Nocardioides sp.]
MSRRRTDARRKRRRARRRQPGLDVHGEYLLESLRALVPTAGSILSAEDPAAEVRAQFDTALGALTDQIDRFEALRLIEVARMAMLLWGRGDQFQVAADGSAAHVELLALMALAVEEQRGAPPVEDPVEVQEMSGFISHARADLDCLLNLSRIQAALAADPTDRLAMISLLVRGSQVEIRHSSYGDVVERTVLDLLDGEPAVRSQLTDGLGFDAYDAVEVLNVVHRLQQDQVNRRAEQFAGTVNTLREAAHGDAAQLEEPSEELEEQLTATWLQAIGNFFEPDLEGSTVSIRDIVTAARAEEARVRAVIKQFTVDISGQTPTRVVDAFMEGNNPLRSRPLITAGGGERVMLPHPTLSMDAVKENLEGCLKTTGAWDAYQRHRGNYLESRVRAAFERVRPGAVFRDSFKYYVPDSDAEDTKVDPARYTKRVEGDHLIVLDDVAIIVEDKAVALSARAKAGKSQRLRNDLTGIITKAADQAARLRQVIESDGGIRIQDEGWVDLSHIREIHTIAVSLDDLMNVATATVELLRADLLAPDNIPWTVSLHDLELIIELIARPAEFLLYLRRRRDPLTTSTYIAPDELDLFLFFFEDGMWVEPDPDLVRKAFPGLGAPTTGERRRFRAQKRAYLTSRTDQLDQWYYTRGKPEGPVAPKPEMFPLPTAPLVDDIAARGVYGWLSVGATLIGGSSALRHKLMRQADDLLAAPAIGRGRSATIPLAQSVNNADGWLLVWATRPVNANPNKAAGEAATERQTPERPQTEKEALNHRAVRKLLLILLQQNLKMRFE